MLNSMQILPITDFFEITSPSPSSNLPLKRTSTIKSSIQPRSLQSPPYSIWTPVHFFHSQVIPRLSMTEVDWSPLDWTVQLESIWTLTNGKSYQSGLESTGVLESSELYSTLLSPPESIWTPLDSSGLQWTLYKIQPSADIDADWSPLHSSPLQSTPLEYSKVKLYIILHYFSSWVWKCDLSLIIVMLYVIL